MWQINRSLNPFTTSDPDNFRRISPLTHAENITALSRTGGGNALVGTAGLPVFYNFDGTRARIVRITELPERFNAVQYIALEYSEEVFNENANQTRIRNVFWIANDRVGVERVIIEEFITNGNLDSAVYYLPQSAFALTTENGGINSVVTAIAVDSIQNILWIGGNNGITRLRLPQRNANAPMARGDFIFPNPFVLSRHSTLSIPAPRNSIVDIYTVSGKLVVSMNENSPEWTRTIDGSHIYRWRIPRNLAPGTYIVAVKSIQSDRVAREETKTYKLVVVK